MTRNLGHQIQELTSIHKGLTSVIESDGETVVSGLLPFEGSANGLETITTSFEIELRIPADFPERLPRVTETGGRISTDYEHLTASGALCLAVPIEQRRIFLEQPTLLGFVNRLVIPYLYGYCYFRKHGRHPFDEAPHGYEGIVRHYVVVLGLRDEMAALAVISFLVEHGYRGHHDCPCGSGRKVRGCHGSVLMELHRNHSATTLRTEFIAIFEVCFARLQAGEVAFPTPLRRQCLRILDSLRGESPCPTPPDLPSPVATD